MAANLLIKYDNFYPQRTTGPPQQRRAGSKAHACLHCPRCGRAVTDAHGVCQHCGEVAFQCRQCRHINYERLDAFLCVECGYCAFGDFSYRLRSDPAPDALSIRSEEDLARAVARLRDRADACADARRELRRLLPECARRARAVAAVATDADGVFAAWPRRAQAPEEGRWAAVDAASFALMAHADARALGTPRAAATLSADLGALLSVVTPSAQGVARLFGYPVPKVPEAWANGARESVELLKQESSVAQFGVVHDEVMAGNEEGSEESKSVRGHSLRVFTDFLAKNDPGLKANTSGHFAGLQRIGDPNDGTALWTTLTDQQQIKSALVARAREREAESRDGNAYIQRAIRQTAGAAGEGPQVNNGGGGEWISEAEVRLQDGNSAAAWKAKAEEAEAKKAKAEAARAEAEVQFQAELAEAKNKANATKNTNPGIEASAVRRSALITADGDHSCVICNVQ